MKSAPRFVRASFSSSLLTAAVAVSVGLFACGGSAPPPAPTPPPAPEVVVAPVVPPPPVAVPAADEDPDESAEPIVLEAEITRPWDKASFPPKQGDEQQCWQSVPIGGNAQKDFDALIGSCGAPLGLREYAKPAHGHLHSVKDKRDTFTLHLLKGLCYRYFAVGDEGIKDIDILVEKKNNVLVGDDKQTGPVAIIDAGKPWCMTEDANYFFNVEVDGVGQGKYIFGVWARPK